MCTLLCGPVCVYWTWIYWSNRRHPVIHKRFYALVILTHCGFFVFMFIFTPVTLIVRCTRANLSKHSEMYMVGVEWFNSAFIVVPIAFGITFRLWHVMYAMKYSVSVQESRWKRLIGPTLRQMQSNKFVLAPGTKTTTTPPPRNESGTNWWIRHNRNLGNERWTLTRVLLPFIAGHRRLLLALL